MFSALLLASDEDGRRLSDREVRDELMTLLLAGHETTATGLAWCFDLVLHAPAVHARALGRDERYLDAVVKESLRIRPVIPGVGRVVRGAPFRLGEYVVPVGMEINPSIRVIHRREDLYPDAGAFRPERFLVDEPPDTYTLDSVRRRTPPLPGGQLCAARDAGRAGPRARACRAASRRSGVGQGAVPRDHAGAPGWRARRAGSPSPSCITRHTSRLRQGVTRHGCPTCPARHASRGRSGVTCYAGPPVAMGRDGSPIHSDQDPR